MSVEQYRLMLAVFIVRACQELGKKCILRKEIELLLPEVKCALGTWGMQNRVHEEVCSDSHALWLTLCKFLREPWQYEYASVVSMQESSFDLRAVTNADPDLFPVIQAHLSFEPQSSG